MNVASEEFVSAREASRALGKLIDRLEAGELRKAVVVDRNQPRAVVVAFHDYDGASSDLEAAARALLTKLSQTHPGDMADREGWLDEWNDLRHVLALIERRRQEPA